MTTSTKKLLILQVHDPPQTIVVYLPHLYLDEGIYSCCTTLSGGEEVCAITWAFGPDGYAAQRMLNTHWIDLDAQERRLQIYKPRLRPDGVPSLSSNDFRANSYLWLRLVTPEASGSAAQAAAAGRPAGSGRQMSSSFRGRGRGRGRYITIPAAEPALRLSVDVLRFEPSKQFQHYSKTTKQSISRLEVYVVNSQTHLEPPVMELLDTVEAFLAPSSSSSTDQGANGADAGVLGQSLVLPAAAAGEEELLRVQQMLQQLPGAFLDDGTSPYALPAAAAAGSAATANTSASSRANGGRPMPEAGAEYTYAAPAGRGRGRSSANMRVPASQGRGRNAAWGPGGRFGQGGRAGAGRGEGSAMSNSRARQEQSQQPGQSRLAVQFSDKESAAAVVQNAINVLVQWAGENKLTAAVRLCEQVRPREAMGPFPSLLF